MATRPNMIEIIANQGGISTVDAERVFEFYRTEKLMTLDGRCSGFKIKHGAYLDRDIIQNALAMLIEGQTDA